MHEISPAALVSPPALHAAAPIVDPAPAFAGSSLAAVFAKNRQHELQIVEAIERSAQLAARKRKIGAGDVPAKRAADARRKAAKKAARRIARARS